MDSELRQTVRQLQFNLGVIAGKCQQIFDLVVEEETKHGNQLENREEILTLAHETRHACVFISAALEKFGT